MNKLLIFIAVFFLFQSTALPAQIRRDKATKPLVPPQHKPKNSNTGKVAYRIPASKLKATMDTLDQKNLMGLQFFFKKVTTGNGQVTISGKSNFITVYPLYYDSLNNSFFLSDKHLFKLKNKNVFSIHSKTSPSGSPQDTTRYYEVGTYNPMAASGFPNPNQAAYENLDHFQSGIDFIFFPWDQLEPILNYYSSFPDGQLVISGSKLVLGKKLGHKVNQGFTRYNRYYFTLKLEGQEADLVALQNNSRGGGSQTVGPDIIIGQPCPPDWYSYPDIYGSANRITQNPLDYRVFRTTWQQQINSKTWSVKTNFQQSANK